MAAGGNPQLLPLTPRRTTTTRWRRCRGCCSMRPDLRLKRGASPQRKPTARSATAAAYARPRQPALSSALAQAGKEVHLRLADAGAGYRITAPTAEGWKLTLRRSAPASTLPQQSHRHRHLDVGTPFLVPRAARRPPGSPACWPPLCGGNRSPGATSNRRGEFERCVRLVLRRARQRREQSGTVVSAPARARETRIAHRRLRWCATGDQDWLR